LSAVTVVPPVIVAATPLTVALAALETVKVIPEVAVKREVAALIV
jgi:cytochrome c oxidase assembly factor CtaG